MASYHLASSEERCVGSAIQTSKCLLEKVLIKLFHIGIVDESMNF